MSGLRVMDLPVLITVWILCVGTDWSTATKIALNVAAVTALCLKEVAVHRHLQRTAASGSGSSSRSVSLAASGAGLRPAH